MKILINICLYFLSIQTFAEHTKVIYNCSNQENTQRIILETSFADFEPISMTYYNNDKEYSCIDLEYYKIPHSLVIDAKVDNEYLLINFTVSLVDAQGNAVIPDYCYPHFDRFGMPRLIPSICESMKKVNAFINFESNSISLDNCTVEFK